MKSLVRMLFFVMVIALVVGCGGKRAGIEGKVVDGKGQPMSGVKVIAKQVQPIKGYEQFETTTGSDGVFRFKGLFPASEYSILFSGSDKWKISAEVTFKSGPEGLTSMLPSPIMFRFTLSNDGVIMDSQLGLQWAPAPAQLMNWLQAQSYAQNLSLSGGGWRLPTESEIESIFNKSMEGGVDPAFHINNNRVWTSEIIDDSAVYFRFVPGNEGWGNFSDSNCRVVAVRSAK